MSNLLTLAPAPSYGVSAVDQLPDWESTAPSPDQATINSAGPAGPFGVLTINGRPNFHYSFTGSDALWLARFVIGEAGGRDDPGSRAVIWSMFNRYAFFTHRVYPTFSRFIRAYSTPLQPVLRSGGAAARHYQSADFVRTGGNYSGKYAHVPRGQRGKFLRLQATPWKFLLASARGLSERALRGQVPNPIGNATEFADTAVYYRQRHGQWPTLDQWRAYNATLGKQKRWAWIGDVQGLVQYHKNAFFVDHRVAKLPPGAVVVSGMRQQPEPTQAPASARSARHDSPNQSEGRFIGDSGLLFEPGPFSFQPEWEVGTASPYQQGFDVFNPLRYAKEMMALRSALRLGERDENKLTDGIFSARHPKRVRQVISRSEPDFQALSREWLAIRDGLVRPALRAPSGPAVTPLPAMTPEEGSAFRQLPVSDQALFRGLRAVILAFTGVARTEADRGGRTLLRRGVFLAVNKLLAEVLELTKITTLVSGWPLVTARPLLIGNVLYNLAFPETINQGGSDRLGGRPDPTCFSASTQMLLARRFPATYVRLVRQLATTSRCTFAGGHSIGPLTFASTSLYKSLDSVLLQTAFDTYFRNRAIVGGNYAPGDELKVHRQIFGPNRPPRRFTDAWSSNAKAAFGRAFVTDGGTTRLPEIINLCTGNPVANCLNHSVVLTRIQGGRVFFYNPWANEEERNRMFGAAQVTVSGHGERPAESSMTKADFENQLTTVFHN